MLLLVFRSCNSFVASVRGLLQTSGVGSLEVLQHRRSW